MYFPVHVKDCIFQIYERVDAHICAECWDNDNTVYPILVAELSKENNWSLSESFNLIFYLKQWKSIEEFGEGSSIFSDHGLLCEELFEKAATFQMFHKALGQMEELKANEKRVLLLRNGFNKQKVFTLEEVGQEMNVTRERVRQIEARALRRLRKKLGVIEPDVTQETKPTVETTQLLPETKAMAAKMVATSGKSGCEDRV